MAKDFDSESQSQIERTIMDSSVSSIEEIELKPEIGEKVSDSVSSGFENCVEMNSENSFESEQGGRITVIDDSTVQEKQEILNADSYFIEKSSSEICAGIKGNQEMSEVVVLESVIGAESDMANDSSFAVERQEIAESGISQFENGVKMNQENSFECEEEGRRITVQEKQETEEIFHLQNVITGDEHLILVVESQETVEKDSMLISQSQNLVEMSNASRRSEDNWDRFVGVNENQISGWPEIETRKADEKWNIQEVKEMPVIFPASVSETGNGCGKKDTGSRALGKKRSGSCTGNIKQEMVRKQEKCFKRNGKGMKKFTETRGRQNLLSLLAEAGNVCQKTADGSKRVYSRNEMEALRFANCDDQRQIWMEIYTGLGPVVARELNGLADSKFQNRNGRNGGNTNQQQRTGYKKDNASILGETCSENVEHHFEENNFEEVNTLNVVCDDHDDGDDHNEDEDSDDDEYDNIQRPAFFVEGDPDFDSGPPQDGLEYLRRVRWEAAQIPKVKVAKLDSSKLNNEQTVYMPEIPDIAKCPQHLQPSKDWEDEFLADFSELRLALSHLEGSKSFPHLSIAEVDDGSRCSRNPTVSIILGMESVSRASMLRRCIKSLETKISLHRNDCAWIFALCAAVDIPLDADTTAYLRGLLRKCASLRAGKSELDDEVVMLNMLVTVSGRYFRQLE
ncbi:Gem-associated protein 2 [Macleaya cordata]|uniref:Gem-associated protein 2 n=1 Tax=Macleaya cordata TaxID=56857 RepID=A0A200QML6_MACCD|nr:Gem-associated protein 2 [Macleaya cordata]